MQIDGFSIAMNFIPIFSCVKNLKSWVRKLSNLCWLVALLRSKLRKTVRSKNSRELVGWTLHRPSFERSNSHAMMLKTDSDAKTFSSSQNLTEYRSRTLVWIAEKTLVAKIQNKVFILRLWSEGSIVINEIRIEWKLKFSPFNPHLCRYIRTSMSWEISTLKVDGNLTGQVSSLLKSEFLDLIRETLQRKWKVKWSAGGNKATEFFPSLFESRLALDTNFFPRNSRIFREIVSSSSVLPELAKFRRF